MTVKRIKLVFFSLWDKNSFKYLFCLGSRHWHFSHYRGRIPDTQRARDAAGPLHRESVLSMSQACPSQGLGWPLLWRQHKPLPKHYNPKSYLSAALSRRAYMAEPTPAQKGTQHKCTRGRQYAEPVPGLSVSWTA